MTMLSGYFDFIDNARVQRAKQLSEVKRTFNLLTGSDPLGIASKSVIVLSYANWEGFYNECADYYVNFLVDREIKIVDASWALLIGAMTPNFNQLRDRHHSEIAKSDFILKIQEKINCDFSDFDRSTILARSNLNFDRLRYNFRLLNLAITPFERYRIRMDRELVGWRHEVAHGSSPDLTAVNVSEHIDFAAELILMVADTFQTAMVQYN